MIALWYTMRQIFRKVYCIKLHASFNQMQLKNSTECERTYSVPVLSAEDADMIAVPGANMNRHGP